MRSIEYLIAELEAADFSHEEIKIETAKHILILTIYHNLGLIIPELYDWNTLNKLHISYRLRNRINAIFKKKEKKNGEKEKKEKSPL